MPGRSSAFSTICSFVRYSARNVASAAPILWRDAIVRSDHALLITGLRPREAGPVVVQSEKAKTDPTTIPHAPGGLLELCGADLLPAAPVPRAPLRNTRLSTAACTRKTRRWPPTSKRTRCTRMRETSSSVARYRETKQPSSVPQRETLGSHRLARPILDVVSMCELYRGLRARPSAAAAGGRAKRHYPLSSRVEEG